VFKSTKAILLAAVVGLILVTAVSDANAGWWGCPPVRCGWDSCGGCGWGCGDGGCGWNAGGCRPRCRAGCWSNCYTSCCSPYYACGRAPCYSSYSASCQDVSYACGCSVPGYRVVAQTNVSSCTCDGGGAVLQTVAPSGSTIPALAPSLPTPTPTKAEPVVPNPMPVTPVTPISPALPTTPFLPTTPTAPAKSPLPGEAPALPLGGGSTYYTPTQADSATLTIWVPAEAKVTINGMPTKSVGSKRQFVSYGLTAGFSYTYVVKAEIVRDGQLVEDSKTVSLTAGDRGGVAFGFNKPTEAVAAN
jgi:uncharacterized protein (TIGR03000 family)